MMGLGKGNGTLFKNGNSWYQFVRFLGCTPSFLENCCFFLQAHFDGILKCPYFPTPLELKTFGKILGHPKGVLRSGNPNEKRDQAFQFFWLSKKLARTIFWCVLQHDKQTPYFSSTKWIMYIKVEGLSSVRDNCYVHIGRIFFPKNIVEIWRFFSQ